MCNSEPSTIYPLVIVGEDKTGVFISFQSIRIFCYFVSCVSGTFEWQQDGHGWKCAEKFTGLTIKILTSDPMSPAHFTTNSPLKIHRTDFRACPAHSWHICDYGSPKLNSRIACCPGPGNIRHSSGTFYHYGYIPQ